MTSREEIFNELQIENDQGQEYLLFEFDDSIPNIPLSLTMNQNQVELPKTMSLANGLALIIGVMVGSGIFASPGPILAYTGSVGASLVIWILAGILALTGGLCYIELGTMIPSSGGEHPYLKRAYGPFLSFLFSWSGILASRPASIAIILTTTGHYTMKLISNSPSKWAVKFVAILLALALTLLNIKSTKNTMNLQNAMTLIKIIALILMAMWGLLITKKTSGITSKPLFDGSSPIPGNYALALFSALWSYDGWNNLNILTGELINCDRNLPLSVIGGVSTVMVGYLITNLSYYNVLSFDVISNSKTIGLDFGLATIGPFGLFVISIIVIISTLGAANASILTGSRVSFVSAQESHAPSFLATINLKTSTPSNALIFQCILAIFFILYGDFNTLVTLFSFFAWIFYFLCVFGLFVLRITEPYTPRPFKVWLLFPFIFCILSIGLLGCSAYQAPQEAILSFIFLMSGVPFYYFKDRLPTLQGIFFTKIGILDIVQETFHNRGQYRKQENLDEEL